ncbi:MAG: 2'-5' RNA ligase family protein [Acidimicrobiales bacterium]
MRLGVALLVPSPLDREIDGMRRALGDGALGRIPAHLTLVPPVNVREDRLDEALVLLRVAGTAVTPITVTLGPPATFLPGTPVLYLPVAEGAEAIGKLRDRVFQDPLARPLGWPFTPHVTLADEATPERIAAAVDALADYRVDVTFDSVFVLQEGPARVWEVMAEAPLGPPRVFGRGGLPLEINTTATVGPEERGLLVSSGQEAVLTARRDGEVVGVLQLALAEGERQLGTAEHLRRALALVELDG